MSEILKLSNSAIDRFVQCPRSFYWDYIAKEKPPTGNVRDFYGHYGTLMHFFAEMYPRTNVEHETGFDFKPTDLEKIGYKPEIEQYLEAYANQLMENKIKLDVEKMLVIYNQLFPMINFESEKTKQEYYLQGVHYIEQIPDKDWTKIVGLEQYFRVDLGNGVVPITGVIDKIERDEQGLIVTDYKTSKPYSANDMVKKNQLPLYGMACYFLYGELPYKYRYDFVRFDKVVEVEIPLQRLTDVKNAIAFRYAQMLAFEKEGNFPTLYNDFFCKSFCPFKDSCETYKQYN